MQDEKDNKDNIDKDRIQSGFNWFFIFMLCDRVSDIRSDLDTWVMQEVVCVSGEEV